MRNIIFLFILFCASWVQAEERSMVIAVVVSAEEQVEKLKLTPSSLKLIYLRKQLYWPNGKHVVPVNLHAEHTLRGQFSQMVLGRLPKQQIDYWNGLYFNGIQPPRTVNSEEAVIRLIAETPGAIGYVNACIVDARVKALLWIDGSNIHTQPLQLNCAN